MCIRDSIDALDVQALHEDDETGYIFEVDLKYPQHLHDLHTDYPLAPEKHIITDHMISPYSYRMKL